MLERVEHDSTHKPFDGALFNLIVRFEYLIETKTMPLTHKVKTALLLAAARLGAKPNRSKYSAVRNSNLVALFAVSSCTELRLKVNDSSMTAQCDG